MTVSFLCILLLPSKILAGQQLKALSDGSFGESLTELVEEYERGTVSREAAQRNPYIARRLILKSKDTGISPGKYGAIDGIRNRRGMYILQFDSISDTKRAEARLEKEKSTVYVVPDRRIYLKETEYTSGEVRTNSTSEEIEEMMSQGPEAIGADILSAELSKAAGSVTVAVLDTGIAFSASELSGRIDQKNAYSFLEGCNANVCLDSFEDCISPAAGHGTHVAGIIANCTKKAGSKVRILPVRVLDSEGGGYSSTVILGIQYAVDHGAQVINLSLGGSAEPDSALKAAIQYAVNKGVLVVAAAGNEGSSLESYEPANFSECIVVGAVDLNKDRANFSNYGATLDVMAPGVSIMSCTYYFAYYQGGWRQVEYALQSGTSMAVPFASGAAALARLKFPGASASELERLLQLCTQDLGKAGWDQYYGYGLLNLSLLSGVQSSQISKAYTQIKAKKGTTAKSSSSSTKKSTSATKTAAKTAAQKKAEEKAAKEKAAKEKAAYYAALYKTQKPQANVNYTIPLQRGKSTKALKVTGLLGSDQIVSWTSGNTAILTVKGAKDGTCSVTAARKKTGTATITALTDSGRKISFRVKVQKKKVKLKGIKGLKKKYTLRKGQSITLQALPYPVTAGKKVKYSSSKKSVVSVSSQGVLTARKPGKAVITVKCGKKKVKVKIKVSRS